MRNRKFPCCGLIAHISVDSTELPLKQKFQMSVLLQQAIHVYNSFPHYLLFLARKLGAEFKRVTLDSGAK